MMREYRLNVDFDQNGSILKLEMPRPSNFHAHLRAEEMMQSVARDIMRWVKHLLVMPNTGPIDTVEKIRAYHGQLMELVHLYQLKVSLIMTIYFTDKLTPKVVEELASLPFPCAVKYYPPHQGATTGSGKGVHFSTMPDTLKEMARYGIPFLGHFESVYDRSGKELPHARREGYFMEHEFPRLRERNPELDICIEHASTALAVEWVKADTSTKTVCTITPQHLLFTATDFNIVSWKNHLKCMPFVKTSEDRAALLAFATSGDPRAILGDDTAPHPSKSKSGSFEDAACGCWLPHSLALYVMAFEEGGALDERFVNFACFNGPRWWGLPLPDPNDRVTILQKTGGEDIPNPTPIVGKDDVIIPLGWTQKEDRLWIGHALAEV